MATLRPIGDIERVIETFKLMLEAPLPQIAETIYVRQDVHVSNMMVALLWAIGEPGGDRFAVLVEAFEETRRKFDRHGNK